MGESVIGAWIAAFLTLGILTFLYKDNVIYKISEAIFIGVSAGYWFITLFWDNLYRKFWVVGIEGGQWELWGGIILGVMMLCRLSRKIGWIARWPMSFIIGAVAGLYMMLYFTSNAMVQIRSTISNLTESVNVGDPYYIIGNIVVAAGTFSGLVYFYFSKEHKGVFGATAKVGIWFIMVTFGAAFGYTVMSRMSLLIGRIDFLLSDWLKLIS
ncbi:MAG: hypothetical protein KAT58_00755 [candidate division Zixibacteria bacterium]|nr:hypothetical protein [candidate division Zixibacteria bacterium]